MKKQRSSYKTETVKEMHIPPDMLPMKVREYSSNGWVIKSVTPHGVSDSMMIVGSKNADYMVEAYRCS